MSVKVHFFHSHVKYFPENLEAMIDSKESLSAKIEKQWKKHQGCWNTNMLADYCWCLERGWWQ